MGLRNECCVCTISFKRGSQFINHVASRQHTINVQRKNWVANHKNLFIVVEGYAQDKSNRIKAKIVISHFHRLGMVNGVNLGDTCLIQFSSRSKVEAVASQVHKIKNVTLAVSTFVESALINEQKKDIAPVISQYLDENLCRRMKETMPRVEVFSCLMEIVNAIQLSQEEIAKRQYVLGKVLQCLQTTYEGCSIFAFGSAVNGLGFSGCDLDLCTNVGFSTASRGDKRSSAKLARELTQLIRRARMAYNIICIGQARIPIIKFVDKETDIQVDLSFSSSLAHYNTQLIKAYMSNNDIVKPYVMILRLWAKIQDLTGGGNPFYLITSYAFTMLCLVYLMLRKDPVVPPLSWLQREYRKNNASPIMVDGWDCSYTTIIPIILKERVSTMELVTEFFEFYSVLDISKYTISPYTGGLIEMSSLRRKVLNAHFTNYILNGVSFQAGNISVQDPFVHSANLTKFLTVSRCQHFQECCQEAANTCRKIDLQQLPLWALFSSELENGDEEDESGDEEDESGDEEDESCDEEDDSEPEIIAEVKRAPLPEEPNLNVFRFCFVRPICISEEGLVSKLNGEDSLSTSAANLILTVLKRCLMATLTTKKCTECGDNCVLYGSCSMGMNLTSNRNNIRRKIVPDRGDPFGFETEVSKTMLRIAGNKSLKLSTPFNFTLHVRNLNGRCKFEVSCRFSNECKIGSNLCALFSSVVSLILKKMAHVKL